MLNSTNSMSFIRKLLDDPEVYGYKDIDEGATAAEQMESDITVCCDEIYLSELEEMMTDSIYEYISEKDYSDYTNNDKKLFFAECYFTASQFLRKYTLKNETENFKSQLDFSNRALMTEKSGKLYTAERYYDLAKSYLLKIDEYSAVEPGLSAMAIRRY